MQRNPALGARFAGEGGRRGVECLGPGQSAEDETHIVGAAFDKLILTDDLGVPIEVDFGADRRGDRGAELFRSPDQLGTD